MNTTLIFNILSILFFICLMNIFTKCENKVYWKNKKTLNNFPFTWKGKNFWYSRSCASVLFAFCKNKEGKWCVLANKRGEGTPDFQGYWNAICGYLDFNESGEECAVRECYEETGLKIDPSSVLLDSVNTNPIESNKQNVVLRYYVILDGIIDDYKTSTDHMEKNEVAEIKWVEVDKLDEYKWAFNHKGLINECFYTNIEA